ncbi:hypothetical protein HO173_008794 [Letharia columbiana]|uniref:Uncharacterized protein n=1 Tax=Letharia columbiana TaxID=112416 RepID=A0A8H6L2H7_9LECA|nr:uncharacterized protein HO173_008794 [Letharia columbiana]KAF6233038.1 hypothetical protein HO173_008794 [Letharia columbiana]
MDEATGMYMTTSKDLESVRKKLKEIEGMCKEVEEVQALLTMLGEIKFPDLGISGDFVLCSRCQEHINLPVGSADPLKPQRSFEYYGISFILIITTLLDISYFRQTGLIWIAVGMVTGFLTPIAFLRWSGGEHYCRRLTHHYFQSWIFSLLIWAYGGAAIGGPGEVTGLEAFINWHLPAQLLHSRYSFRYSTGNWHSMIFIQARNAVPTQPAGNRRRRASFLAATNERSSASASRADRELIPYNDPRRSPSPDERDAIRRLTSALDECERMPVGHASERVQVRHNELIRSPGGGGMDRSSEAGF